MDKIKNWKYKNSREERKVETPKRHLLNTHTKFNPLTQFERAVEPLKKPTKKPKYMKCGEILIS